MTGQDTVGLDLPKTILSGEPIYSPLCHMVTAPVVIVACWTYSGLTEMGHVHYVECLGTLPKASMTK